MHGCRPALGHLLHRLGIAGYGADLGEIRRRLIERGLAVPLGAAVPHAPARAAGGRAGSRWSPRIRRSACWQRLAPAARTRGRAAAGPAAALHGSRVGCYRSRVPSRAGHWIRRCSTLIWKRVSREVILFFAFFLPPERKRRAGAPAARQGGVPQAAARRRRDRLVRQERADLAAGAAVALLPAALRAAARRRSSASTTCTARTTASRGCSSPTTTTCATSPATSTARRDFYGKKVVLLVRQPADVAVSQFHQWKFRMRPHKKGLNKYPEHGQRGRRLQLRHGRGCRPAQGDRLHERLGAGAAEARAAADRALRGPARATRRASSRRVLEFMGQQPTDAELADCVAFASVENMRKLEEKSTFWLAGSRMQAGRQGQPGFVQGAPRQGRRLPRLFRRRAGRASSTR